MIKKVNKKFFLIKKTFTLLSPLPLRVKIVEKTTNINKVKRVKKYNLTSLPHQELQH
jgi:hypothetical protein